MQDPTWIHNSNMFHLFYMKYDLNKTWVLAKIIFKTIILRKLFYSPSTVLHWYIHRQLNQHKNSYKQSHHNFQSIWIVIYVQWYISFEDIYMYYFSIQHARYPCPLLWYMFPAFLEMYAMKSKMNSILLSRPMTFEKKLFPVGVI